MMDHHLKEKLSRFAAVLLAVVAAIPFAAALFVCTGDGLNESIAMSRARAFFADSVGREGYYNMLLVTADPPATTRAPQWFWIIDGGKLIDSPTGRAGYSLYKYAGPLRKGEAVTPRSNPYTGAAFCSAGKSWQYKAKTPLVLVDIALFDDAGSAAAFTQSQLEKYLDGSFHTAYLAPRDRNDLLERKTKLQAASDSPFLLAAALDSQSDSDYALWLLDRIRGFLRARPIVVTADSELADICNSKDYKVVLVDAEHLQKGNLNRHYISHVSQLRSTLDSWIK